MAAQLPQLMQLFNDGSFKNKSSTTCGIGKFKSIFRATASEKPNFINPIVIQILTQLKIIKNFH